MDDRARDRTAVFGATPLFPRWRRGGGRGEGGRFRLELEDEAKGIVDFREFAL